MSYPHAIPDYPLAITKEEERLGFEIWEVFGINESLYAPIWIPAVCRALTNNDIIIKTNDFSGSGWVYSHRRFGWMTPMKTGPARWCPIGMPSRDAANALFEAEIESDGLGHPEVYGIEGGIRRVKSA